jgi:YcaO-like protein with predicted kinase domain
MMQLLEQHPISELRDGLRRREPIVYRQNGNRTMDGREFLERARVLAQRVGIQRIAEISSLSPFDFPVFQSTRPGVLHHAMLGQNTGAQGKGVDAVQAEISCIMESVEMFCAEPRDVRLCRGSYEFLRNQHVVVDPTRMFRRYGAAAPTKDEPFMWTPALHLQSQRELLVPAESVYFYFPAGTFDTRSVFPMGTSGLGSGATYLEAINHAIYELVERMYHAYFERGQAMVHCLWEEEFDEPSFRRVLGVLGGEFELQLFTVELPGIENLPMITAMLVGDDAAFIGQGAASDVRTAILRAVSEALQAFATVASGSREDIGRGSDVSRGAERNVTGQLPEFRNRRIAEHETTVVNRTFDDLGAELEFLLGWLDRAGFPGACAANLTRYGIDVPVVRVIVPSMPMERISQCEARPHPVSEDRIAQLKYSFRREGSP